MERYKVVTLQTKDDTYPMARKPSDEDIAERLSELAEEGWRVVLCLHWDWMDATFLLEKVGIDNQE